jgi:hypothetical protein
MKLPQLTVRFFAGLVLALSALVLPANASAQTCRGGRVRVSGRCCWPGQDWSNQARACVGPPQCPTGMVEEGETCVPDTTPAASPTTSTAPTGPSAETRPAGIVGTGQITPTGTLETRATTIEGWPSATAGRLSSEIRRPILRGTPSIPGIVGGTVVLGVGYLVGFFVALGMDQSYECRSRSCIAWPIALIPIGGVIPSILVSIRSSAIPAVLAGVPLTVTQLVGALIIIGNLGSQKVVRSEARNRDIEVMMTAGPSDGPGAGLLVRF